MSFIDAHAHLTSEEGKDLRPLLERAQAASVASIINVCTSLNDLHRGLKLSSTTPKIYTTAAQTPHDAATFDEPFFVEVEKSVKSLVAIGEIGLDYHYDLAPRESQKQLFSRYLELAVKCKLPIVIHCREAFNDLEEMILHASRDLGVMLHCFTGTKDEAKRALNHGWYVSLSGIVTFPKSLELQEVARYLPEDRLLLETDSPYLAPQGFRGKVNEPGFLPVTAKYVADLRQVSIDQLAHATSENVRRLFHGVS